MKSKICVTEKISPLKKLGSYCFFFIGYATPWKKVDTAFIMEISTFLDSEKKLVIN